VLDRTSAELGQIAQTILDSVAKIRYNPANINSILSDYTAKLGTIVHTEFGDHLVCENMLSGVMLINQNLISRGKEDYEEQSTISGYEYSVTDEDLKAKTKVLAEQYYLYTNTKDITVGDSETKTIISIRFVSTESTTVVFHAEVLLDVDTTVSGITYDDAVGKITYYINEAEVTGYNPTETWVDGKHVLHLLYFIDVQGARTIIFRADLNMDGGSAFIKKNNIQASVRGQGLLESTKWNGIFVINESMANNTADLTDNLVASATFTEDVDITFFNKLSDMVVSDDMSNVTADLTDIFGTINMQEPVSVITQAEE
jgi:hypothetical protein